MDIDKLKQQLSTILPLLEFNCSLAYTEWKDGVLSNGAYRVVMDRLSLAQTVIAATNLDPLAAYKACSPITCDLRSAIKDSPNDNTNVMENWLLCFAEAGFVKPHPIFRFPMQIPEFDAHLATEVANDTR